MPDLFLKDRRLLAVGESFEAGAARGGQTELCTEGNVILKYTKWNFGGHQRSGAVSETPASQARWVRDN